MASEHNPPHLANCDCAYCSPHQLEDRKNPFETAIVAMPRDRKDHAKEDSYETASDSDNDRTKKDESIRQAPYLPRIQIWARESGPYTLRIGHQWFHCDDLLINGDEYRQQAKKMAAAAPQLRSAQPTSSGPSSASKRNQMSRAQSYQRTRPDATPTAAPAARPTNAFVRQPSREKVERSGRYDSQALPDPRRKQVVKKSAPRPKESEGTSPPTKSDSHLPAPATDGQLVRYKSAPTDLPPAHSALKQARPNRPGRMLSRGNSYQIPVRNKARKAVRFDVPT